MVANSFAHVSEGEEVDDAGMAKVRPPKFTNVHLGNLQSPHSLRVAHRWAL